MTADIEKKQIQVGKYLWRYLAVGNGSGGLVILAGSLGVGEGIVRWMAQVAPSRRVVALEYAPVATVADCLDAIDRVLQNEGIGTTVLYGGSFGGLIAQCWVRRHPDRVTHLILSGSGLPDAGRAKNNRRLLRCLPLIPIGLVRFLMRIGLWNMLRQVKQNRETWRADFRRLIAQLNSSDLASRYQIAIDFDQNYNFSASDLRGFPTKILLLEGSADRIANATTRNKVRRLYPEARVHSFQGAGHALLLTHTKEWTDLLSEFLEDSPQRALRTQPGSHNQN